MREISVLFIFILAALSDVTSAIPQTIPDAQQYCSSIRNEHYKKVAKEFSKQSKKKP
jgi:hypothetical protein